MISYRGYISLWMDHSPDYDNIIILLFSAHRQTSSRTKTKSSLNDDAPLRHLDVLIIIHYYNRHENKLRILVSVRIGCRKQENGFLVQSLTNLNLNIFLFTQYARNLRKDIYTTYIIIYVVYG